MKTEATHVQILQSVHCRGLHLEAGKKHAVASLTQDQLDDLLSNGFAVGCEAPAESEAPAKAELPTQKEAAEAAPEAESAALSTKPRRRRPVLPQ